MTDVRILFVSHCDFEGNSAYHVLGLARALAELGVEPCVCIPDNIETVSIVGEQPFAIVTYGQGLAGAELFRGGRAPSLIHAFTPREHVRKFTETMSARFGRPYLVHLEDNERTIVEDEVGNQTYEALSRLPREYVDGLITAWRTHPVRGREFLGSASGVTVVIDRLLEQVDESVPSRVIWPGFDFDVSAERDVGGLRTYLGLRSDEFVVTYTGNIHASNLAEVRSLYLAIALLRRGGLPVRLLKTGWNHAGMDWVAQIGAGDLVLDLGFVSRERVWDLLRVSDVLVQPGRAGDFNDYRFPSKIPDFLASARPVVLPRTNVGRFLEDGEEAVLLHRGDAHEIAEAVERLAAVPEEGTRIGRGGRAFAERNLTWSRAATDVLSLYEEVLRDGSAARSGHVWRPDPPAKLVAFYLPQFHTIPENDEWWGEGFTEWTNVRRGEPLFDGHHQPHVPLGRRYYDLGDPTVMEEQAALARAYGIYGFCFYYYWFNGKRLLDRPLESMLANDRITMPFCYCWANENWTRRWDGLDEEVLLGQDYEPGWEDRFLTDLLPALSDARYIRVRGRPLLLIYRANLIPDPCKAAESWREIARRDLGTDLHLSAVQSFGLSDPRRYGFDSAVEFPPHTERFLLERSAVDGLVEDFEGYLEDYGQVMRHQLARPLPEYEWFRGAMPSWDNTARRGKAAHILVGSTPERYGEWLRKLVLQAMLRSTVDEPLIFLNAWNEWAEGTHLEPDERYGTAWLEATRDALVDGAETYYALAGHPIGRHAVEDHLRFTLPGLAEPPLPTSPHPSEAAPPSARQTSRATVARPRRRPSLTDNWFGNSELERLAARYREFSTDPLGYATVRDYVDSWEHLRPLASAQGDLKDAQRPWVFKAILGNVPEGGRVLEIGAGQPYVADMLSRLGYDVWIVDPYDGSGNGPREFETFRRGSPMVNFVRSTFGPASTDLVPAGVFDCVYSISVLEHVPLLEIDGVAEEIARTLRQSGTTLHAVDHVRRGAGAEEHHTKLSRLVGVLGEDVAALEDVLERSDRDTETYLLSAEAHNRWRGETPYEVFPMRVCMSVQTVVHAKRVQQTLAREADREGAGTDRR